MKTPKIHKPRWMTQIQINALIVNIILGALSWRLMTLLDHIIKNGGDNGPDQAIVMQLLLALAGAMAAIGYCAKQFATTKEDPEENHDHISGANPRGIGAEDTDSR